MRLTRTHFHAASVTVGRSVLTMVVCIGIGAVLFALKPGLASSIREMIHIPRTMPSSISDQVAQSDENETEEPQVVPGVSSVFLTKLSAITESAASPDQKLSDLDALVRSYGWPSTPPAIDKVVTEARRKIALEKNANSDTQKPYPYAGDIDLSQKPEDEQLGTFAAFSGKFFVAQYCSDNGAFFTPDDVERLKSEYQKIFSTMTVSQEKKDAIWQRIQAVGPTQLAGITGEACAAEKQSYLFMWPEVFAPTDPIANPF